MRNTRITLSLLFLCAALGILVLSSFNTGLPSFQKAVKQVVQNTKLKGAQIGISIRNLKNGEEIVGHNSDVLHIPASTLKLVTSFAAIDILGPAFTFKTEWIAHGNIDNGILKGNLLVKGNGDPSFGSEIMWPKGEFQKVLQQFATAVKDAGITKIEGEVLIDESYLPFPPEHATWQWMDLGNYFASGAWAINAHDNLFTITFKQTEILGQTPEIVKIEPEVPGLILKNEVQTAAANTGDNAYIFGAPYQDMRIIRGTIPAGTSLFSIKGSLPYPGKFLHYHLTKTLENNGIQVANNSYTVQNEIARTLIVKESPPLSKLLELANKESNNLICEALYHELGKQWKNSSGKKYDGKMAISEWLQNMSKTSVPFNLEDGSGLSMKNGIAPETLTRLLFEASKNKHFKVWKNTLPVAGKEGTVKNLIKNPSAFKLYVKSGSLGKVRCYAGYLQLSSGEEFAVCIMINQHQISSGAIREIFSNFFQTLGAG
jgi:D-alanyl-D-alanine carboxypeptidase/D-alanyl-D-alanine-endopeptidase (penicillin-binding protein 4)